MQKYGFLKDFPDVSSSKAFIYIQKHICLLDNDMLNRMNVTFSIDSYSAFDAAARSF